MKKLLLILTISVFAVSCGKKEETENTPPQNQQQMTQTQQQTQTTEQNKQDEQKKDEMKKEEEKKNDDEKKKEDEKKKDEKKTDPNAKDENVKKTNEDANKDSKQDIDFASIYAKRCAKCHGKDLKGKPDGGPDLTRSETQNKSDSKLFNIISTGVKAENEDDEDMPAFKGKLSDDEIKAAIEYIKKH